MSPLPRILNLEVQPVEQTCWFKLSWGQGQQLSAHLAYPAGLKRCYQEWQQAYRNFYRQFPVAPLEELHQDSESALRGRVLKSVGLQMPPTDWQIKLVQAEANLLYEFHRWLRSAELYEIRKTIAHASQQVAIADLGEIEVFFACGDLDLARLPWESWEICTEFTATGSIRVVRTPVNIHHEPEQHPSHLRHQRRNRTRVLAILGDETGLDFQVDRDAVRSLARIAEVKFMGWQPGQQSAEVKRHIQQALADEMGWDVLFFAGHSNEAEMIGGELAVAPKTSLSIKEIAPQLALARQRGLQFALFNSCNGLNIAESLIDLGFSQVVVMREPIHNRVAQAFLIEFLQALAKHRDVHESLLLACQMLKVEKNLTYPSTYLIPFLFAHPGATLFRIPKPKPLWRRVLRYLMPTRSEAGALVAACLLLSPLLPIQAYLLDQRIWFQAIWREWTHQVPLATPPPVALIQVDQASTSRKDSPIAKPDPMNQSYLADLIDRLSQQSAGVIGIDYLLDRSDPRSSANTVRLRQSLQNAAQQGTELVFGTVYESDSQPIFTPEAPGIAERTWSMQGYVSLLPAYVSLPYPGEDCTQTCPFAYLLALTQTAKKSQIPVLKSSSAQQTDLRSQLVKTIDQTRPQDETLASLRQQRLTPIATWSYEALGISWFKPIIDYSIPPDRIYTRVSAWRLRDDNSLVLPLLPNQIALIGAGDYTDSGSKVKDQLDLYPVPLAVQYWRDRLSPDNQAGAFPSDRSENVPPYLSDLTGVEVHAYMVHHLLTQQLIVPIPDILTMGIAALLGRTIVSVVQQQSWTRKGRLWYGLGLISAAILYGLVSLQLYITAHVLLPWLLPSLVLWTYVLPKFWRKPDA